ncbi:MAG: hypothetical protein A2268_05395 [Candidatus Raymondbacteria bacterium RifOxyA12_full_50_37]|uniref:DUF4423 domain-containing protein n=1 Tax=Candidatus Raymondbacteria bacterium RIFOXYD12_FULL_49_13 TaxID=1817890 RepID=A0A1F7FBI9_UNCRA|nr:MAG: hypothetical protein A2268_05395 [Candidatus Raymondbacteria bacterium RifOxyA12_full_50_37]OGJ88999.1 MAG: hypothetical protein A2248_02630 [Candidatus Raymondbacteria bacterium RIFOXYA2_FULL_49_16]OGJ92508.1 MAG: hypothetical protein A2350_15775 [Candidatus Raymondbacteria bacterium RifOxyB12_full_50_8]OGJ97026.1 MAG: hypothetical protein A2453_04045 [Candidatus Raymondbacteria bacterium RIFOXYC2_FULL_50_21]OGK04024.1 MAG: hypothetical protein A2519_00785 [Candidatus Raymondbacteria b
MHRIESYSDYRAFLKDLFAEKKRLNPSFSYRVFNRLAGIRSPSLFMEVVKGKRNLSRKALSAFARAFGLKPAETRFFTLLVKFTQAKDLSEKQAYLEQMRGLTPNVDRKIVPASHYDYYSCWYNPIIRELACTLDWKGDYLTLAKAVHPPITKGQAHQSMDILVRLGFLAKQKNGSYIQTNPSITTGPEVVSLGVRKMNTEFAKLGVQAIDRFLPLERDVSSMTLGISEKGFGLLKREIQEFKRRVAFIVDDDKESDRVFNMNIQLFPVSRKRTKESI